MIDEKVAMMKLEFRELNVDRLPVTEWITREGPNPRAILTEFAAEILPANDFTIIETKHHGCWEISAKQHIDYAAKHIGKIIQYTSCEDAEPDYRFIQSDEEAAS